MTGARYQIAVDGQPRSNRDDRAIAIEAAEYIKYQHPHAEVTVLDLETGARGRHGFAGDMGRMYHGRIETPRAGLADCT